jgi:hypothetical protein
MPAREAVIVLDKLGLLKGDLHKLTKQFEDNCSCEEVLNTSQKSRNRDVKEYIKKQ